MSDPTPRREYQRRLNAVLDHIEQHLAEPITLDQLAAVANFSPFHFHRLFASHLGETVAVYVKRRRLQRAARRLLSHRHEPMLTIALDCGFGSAEVFSRSFRAAFGKTPTAWRRDGRVSKNSQVVRKDGQDATRPTHEDDGSTSNPPWETLMANIDSVLHMITVTEHPSVRVAYLRQIGPYGPAIAPLWQRFMSWCASHHQHGVAYGVAWDDQDVTPPERCRYDACVTVDDDFKPSGDISVQTLAGGRYAQMPFSGTAATVSEGWLTLMRDWLPDSGYQLDDRPCYELYRPEDLAASPPGGFCCLLCIPVRPL